jgi:hypothetical protein
VSSRAAGPRRPCAAALLAAAALAAAISACGGDDGEAADAGADARPTADAALVACSPDAGCDGEPLTPVCDLARSVCVECLGASDCRRSGSFGPSCEEASGYCRCESDDDCAGNANGPTCNAATHACTCLLDTDCADGEECELEPYLGLDVRTCRPGSAR